MQAFLFQTKIFWLLKSHFSQENLHKTAQLPQIFGGDTDPLCGLPDFWITIRRGSKTPNEETDQNP